MALETREAGAIYLGIVGGNITKRSSKDDPTAVKREYEDKDGNKKVVYEHQYSKLTGNIIKWQFRDGKYGEEFQLSIQDVDEVYVVSMKTSERYFQDFAQKFKEIDLSKEVTLSPYDFVDENDKIIRGISVYQDDQKLFSHYYDPEAKKTIGGMPTVSKKEAKGYDGDDWKMHFIKVKKFLKKEIESVEIPQGVVVNTNTTKATLEPAANLVDDDDDLPF